jgi:hypothetical protein
MMFTMNSYLLASGALDRGSNDKNDLAMTTI